MINRRFHTVKLDYPPSLPRARLAPSIQHAVYIRFRGFQQSPSIESAGTLRGFSLLDILPALKREDSHGTAPLGWDIVVYDVTCS